MKRKALALVLLFALSLSAIARTKFVNLAKANPTVYCNMSPPVISIHSPINDTYIEDRILLNLTITKPIDWLVSMSAPGWQVSQELQEVNYQLYGKIYGSVTPKSDLSSPFNFSAYLTNLTDGAHRLVVTAYASGFEYAQWYSRPRSFQVYSSSNVTFAIDTTFPSVLVLRLENMTYSTPDVALNFTVSEPVSLIKYSIDGQGNVTVYGNTTLAGLSSGNHSVTVYVWDRAGHAGASDITHFTMYEPEPAFFPTTLAIATIALVVVIGVGLLVYFKKRNNNHNLLHHVVNDGAS